MQDLQSRAKRPRSLSPSSSSGCSSPSTLSAGSHTRSPSPPPKVYRPTPTDGPLGAFTCALPPTCNQPSSSTSYSTQAELERHQEHHHRCVCRVPVRDRYRGAHAYGLGSGPGPSASERMPDGFVSGSFRSALRECGKVFPDDRFLQLHQIETHDNIARLQKEGGGRIFECFIPAPECGKRFREPAGRRKHLIAKHKYPNNFFFAVTNHGLNSIIEQEGFAASLLRPKRYIDPSRAWPATEEAGAAASQPSADPAFDSSQPDPTGEDGVSRGFMDDGNIEAGMSTVPGQANGGKQGRRPPNDEDAAMEGIVAEMESSLSLQPRQLRRKQKPKSDLAPTPA